MSKQLGNALQAIRRLTHRKRGVDADAADKQADFLHRYGMGSKAAHSVNGTGGASGSKATATSTTQVTVANGGHATKTGNTTNSSSWKFLVMDPSSNSYYRWLGIISLAVIYNLVIIIARSVFWELQERYVVAWLILDYVCDFIYIMDMVVQLRTAYYDQGIAVDDSALLARNYVRKVIFKLDIISIVPTDLIYLGSGLNFPIVRLNRLLRLTRFSEFLDRTEIRTNYTNLFRIINLLFWLLLAFHWDACIYYQISYWIGLGSDTWVNPDDPSLTVNYFGAYLWAMLMLTTIGNTPVAIYDLELFIDVIEYLMGIIVFASVVGSVDGTITSMGAERAAFQRRVDNTRRFMIDNNVSADLQQRVINWLDYLWRNKQSTNQEAVLDTLPDKLKAEIAMQVHLETLRRVAIFKDCEPGLLVELVLKLRLSVFSPGDYICRKGDVGREMYIVKSGKLVVVGQDEKVVFSTLSEGSVFGEVSLLNIAGNKNGNRRTANIRSVGYSDLFVLSKDDLWEALSEYPDAKALMMQRGRQILLKDNLLDEKQSRKIDEEEKLIKQTAEFIEQLLDKLQTQFARILADFNGVCFKLDQRLAILEKESGVVEGYDGGLRSESFALVALKRKQYRRNTLKHSQDLLNEAKRPRKRSYSLSGQ